jgi:hypothetical protein
MKGKSRMDNTEDKQNIKPQHRKPESIDHTNKPGDDPKYSRRVA